MANTRNWNISVQAALLLLMVTTTRVCSYFLNECGKPADVIFILDSSGSIYRHEFERQLQFVNDVVTRFDIGKHHMRVGAMSFSNWAFLEFHLNSYYTKYELHQAISQVPHAKGDTNLAAALTFVKDTMFTSEHGTRFDVPRVAIVLTDGESNDPIATAYTAEAARRMGIQIFAVGIGHQVNQYELETIASYPKETFLFHVANYEALQSITDTLAIKACEVTTPKPTPPTPEPIMIVDRVCGDDVMADVVFAVSPRGSDINTEKALEFFRQLALGLDIDDNKVRVGLVPKDCRDIPEINLKTFNKKDEALQTLDRLSSQEQADTADVLKYMRKTSFHPRSGSRPRAKKVALLLVDESPENMDKAKKEARRLQKKEDVEMFIIGIGKQVRQSDLHRLASGPTERHVFHVSDYDDLSSVLPTVQQAICPVPRL